MADNNLKRGLIIAIDGHSSCGKSTYAKAIAKLLKYAYIDTGAMYRSVTVYALRNNIIHKDNLDEEALINSLDNIAITFKCNADTNQNETFLNGENVEREIRDVNASAWVSKVSAIPQIRKRMVEVQRKMGELGGVVMDGRDIGTVVFPNADIKLFMTASAEVRAQRRYLELVEKNMLADKKQIMENILYRDKIDSTRTESPLVQADDAILLDNSNMTLDQQMDWFQQTFGELLA